MKIGFYITVRMKSSRLKRKVLLNLNGKPIIQRIIDRCLATKGIDDVVLCTSTNPQDSIFYDYAMNNRIKFWAGNEVDVLKRLLGASEYYGFDAFLNITADNPLFSITISDLLVDMYKKNKFDFIFTKGLPIGCYPYFLSTDALKVVCFMKKQTDTEIWGPFVNRSDFFNIGELIVKNSPFKEDKRLTCDYPEDYELLKKLYSSFDSEYVIRLTEIFDVLTEKPEIWKINENCTQRGVSKERFTEINKQFDSQKKSGLAYAKKNLIRLIPNRTKIEFEIQL